MAPISPSHDMYYRGPEPTQRESARWFPDAPAGATVEIWYTRMSFPGPDHSLAILRDEQGKELQRLEIPGY